MKRNTTVAICIALSTLFFSLTANALEIKYEVWVQTGNENGASTSAAVSIVLTNENGASSPELPLKKSTANQVPFQKGKLDKFSLDIAKDLGPIKTITVKSDDAGKEPEWRLESVKIFYAPPSGKPDPRYPVEGGRNATNFHYGNWLAKGKRLVVTLETTDRIAAAAPQSPKPPAPDRLTATAESASATSLRWVDRSKGRTGFKIERSAAADGGFAEIGEVGAGESSFTSANLASNTTYYFRVRARDANGYSDYSATVSARTKVLDPPVNLKVDNITTNSLYLKWTNLSHMGEQQWLIERSNSSTDGFTQIASPGGVNTHQHYVQQLTANTTYYFRIRCKKGATYSEYSATVSATTLATNLNAPYGLSSLFPSSCGVLLKWQDNSSNETGFKIERSAAANSGFVEIASVNANVVEYRIASGLAPATRYYFRVRAAFQDGYSDYSNVSYIMTTQVEPPHTIFANALSDTSILIKWVTRADWAAVIVEQSRSADGGFSEVATVTHNASDPPISYNFPVAGLSPGTTYYFRLKKKNLGGYFSEYARLVFATTAGNVTVPRNLIATAQSSGSIKIDWTDRSNNELGFKIERSTAANGGFTEIASVGANVKTYTATGLTRDTTYYFRVRAYSTAFNSDYSNTASAKTPPQ